MLLSGFFFEGRLGFVQPDVHRLELGTNRWHHRVDQTLINDLPGGALQSKKTVDFLPAWAKPPRGSCEMVYLARIENTGQLEQIILDREKLPLRCIDKPIFATAEQLLSAKTGECE